MIVGFVCVIASSFKPNLARFLDAVIPVAEECGVRMAIHPDDPPFSVLGLPRIVSTETDTAAILALADSPAGLMAGQNPYACILSCADSRVSPEFCFDESRGDLFVNRLAGNYVSPDILASIEYGAAVLNAPVIMVLGHTECGAVKAAIKADKDNVDFPGHIQGITTALNPAVKAGEKDGGDLLGATTLANVKINVAMLKGSTPLLRKLVQEKKLIVVGGLYHLDTGKVDLVV